MDGGGVLLRLYNYSKDNIRLKNNDSVLPEYFNRFRFKYFFHLGDTTHLTGHSTDSTITDNEASESKGGHTKKVLFVEKLGVWGGGVVGVKPPIIKHKCVILFDSILLASIKILFKTVKN